MPPKTRSLFLFGHDNAVREIALHTCTAPWFDAFILFIIVGNAIMMALEDPLDSSRDACPRDPCPDDARSTLELLCNLVFTAELLVKVLSFGFVIGEGTYLRSGWNILDFIIGAWASALCLSTRQRVRLTRGVAYGGPVVTAWLPYVISNVAATNALRVLRVLRPLRTISRFPGLKYVAHSDHSAVVNQVCVS